MTAPAPTQRLTLVERATSRWIGSSTPRHPITLAVCTATIFAADLVGASIDRRAYIVMGLWALEAWFAGNWCAAHPDFAVRVRRYALGVIVDVLFLAVVFAFLDGAQSLGVSFFALMVVAASSVLPRRWALTVGVVSLVSFAALVAYDVYGPHEISSPLGLPAVTGNDSYFIATVGAAAVLIYLLLRTYAQVSSAMQESESRHQAVVAAANDAIILFDGEGRIVEVNPAMLNNTGYTWEALKSMPNSGLFLPEDWPTALGAFERAIAGAASEFEARIVLKSGEKRWVEISTAAISVDGRPGVVAVARDTTERRRQQERLRDNDAKLGLVLDALNSGFYTIDTAQIVTSVRGRGSGATETGTSRLVGKSVVAIAPSPEQAVEQREKHALALTGEIVTWVWPVGSGRWIRSHVAPVRDASGTIVGAAGFWRDESAIVRAREEKDSRWNRLGHPGQTPAPREGGSGE